MVQKAKIEIRARNVKETLGVFQHLFIIHTISDGKETVIRGGPDSGTEFFGDIKVIKMPYEKDALGRKSADWVAGPIPRVVNAEGTDIRINALVERMWVRGQEINQKQYDYKFPTVGHIQNSNTVVADLVKVAGLVLKIPVGLDGKPINVPGVESFFKQTEGDKFLQENACDWMGATDCQEYREKMKKKFAETNNILQKNLPNNQGSEKNSPIGEQMRAVDQIFTDFSNPEVLDERLNNIERFNILSEKAKSQERDGDSETYRDQAQNLGRINDFIEVTQTMNLLNKEMSNRERFLKLAQASKMQGNEGEQKRYEELAHQFELVESFARNIAGDKPNINDHDN
jgi:hypothetical protein